MEMSFVSVVCLCIPLVVRGSFVAVHLNTSPVTYNGESLADLWGRGSVDAGLPLPPGGAAVRRLVQRVKTQITTIYHAENEENILDRVLKNLHYH